MPNDKTTLRSLVGVQLPCTQCRSIIPFEHQPTIELSNEHFLARMIFVANCPNCCQRNVISVILKPIFAHYILEYGTTVTYTVDRLGVDKPTEIEVCL